MPEDNIDSEATELGSNPTDAKKNQGDIEAQNERFREAALRLEKMEEELVELIKSNPSKRFPNNEPYLSYDKKSGSITFVDVVETIKDANGGGATIAFSYDEKTPIGFNITDLEAKFRLEISTYTDRETLDSYNEFFKKMPMSDRRAFTVYLFKEGEYRKMSEVPNQFELPESYNAQVVGGGVIANQKLNPLRIFESPMTPEDFEIAGQALASLKNQFSSAPNSSGQIDE